jgi:anti-sigma factor RsiW
MDLHDLTPGYALDALDPAEREEYEGHLATCERCREELEGFWHASGSLARAAGGPPPPASLRERILEQARRERPNERPGSVVPLRRRIALPALSSVAAVAAVVAIGLGIWAASLSDELDDVRAQRAGEAEAVAILSDPRRQEVELMGADGHLVVSATGRAALVVSGIDRAPEGKTYEIWVIEGGMAKPAGLFEDASTRTVLTLARPVPDDAIVAVTVERDGGASLPTGTPIITSPSV